MNSNCFKDYQLHKLFSVIPSVPFLLLARRD
jgi:hypothetical protein